MSTETATVDAIIADAKLAMSAKHVPSEYDPKAGKDVFQGIKWACMFQTPRGEMSVPFTQGIGHLPDDVYRPTWSRGFTNGELDKINHALKTGYVGNSSRRLAPPSIYDVLSCLFSDADALESTFEDWCGNFGYDSDSRKAESTFKACRETGLDLLRILGAEHFEAMRDAISEAGF